MPSTTNADDPSSGRDGAGNGNGQNEASETTPLIHRPEEGTTEDDDPEFASFGQRVRRWQRERRISACLTIFLMAVVIVMVVLFAVYRSSYGGIHSDNALCLTPACIHAADQFLQNLSPSYQTLDPCTQFDDLVCGGWRSQHQLRPDQGSLNAMAIMAEDNEMLLRSILEGVYPSSSDHSSFSPMNLAAATVSVDEQNFDELQRAYNACMAKSDIQKLGVAPIERLLKDVAELYPVDEASYYGVEDPVGAESSASMADTILYLERIGLDSFVSLSARADDKNPDNVVVFASPRYEVGLPGKGYYENKNLVAQYQEVIGEILGAIHPSKQARKQSGSLAKAVVDLESKLAAASPELEDLQDVTKSYNPMSLADTAKLAPQLGLDNVLNALVPSGYKIDKMITPFPEYLANTSDILQSTSKHTVQAFFLWKVIQATSSDVEAPEMKPYTRFMNQLLGKDPDAVTERYKTCLAHVDDGLGWILSRFFVEAAFSAKAKDLGNQIISDIKDQFIKTVKTLDWMDDEVKKVAITKVNNIEQKIGYPTKSPNVMRPDDLVRYYESLNITDVFFNNSIAMSELAVNKSWAQLGKPVDRDQWGMTAATVNAYYNPPGNEIVFPAGIMQFPIFDVDLPLYVSYGAFGSVSGHELSHAFDNNGRNYDVNGRLTDWWTERTVAEFEERADCFVAEYDNFTVDGSTGTLHVHGRQTLGENIADAGGLAASFAAWQSRRQAHREEDLPGLQFFTQEQLFYVVYGNTWCSKWTPAALTRSILTDEHSPSMWRLQGAAMMNSRGFREAFKCPVREPTCELW